MTCALREAVMPGPEIELLIIADPMATPSSDPKCLKANLTPEATA